MSWFRSILLAALALSSLKAAAQLTNETIATAAAMLCTGSPNYDGGADLTGLNFGGAGTLAVAPAGSAKGEFQTLLRFNLAASLATFNAAYGSNHWVVSRVLLVLTSNYGTAGVAPNNPLFNVISGGQFVIEWLADDEWLPGTGTPNLPTSDGVCYDSLPGLLAQNHLPLGTNDYSPPGDNVPVFWPLPLAAPLIAALAGGSDLNLRCYAADQQVGYLFNSPKYGRGNEPRIQLVAAPVLQIMTAAFIPGGFQLTGLGNIHTTYHVQATPRLDSAGWTNLATVTADGAGQIVFVDPSPGQAAQRFYRLAP